MGSLARVTELSAVSDQSFEDAINMAVSRATRTLRGIESAWVKDMNVLVENGNISGYKVNLAITFILDDPEEQLG
jgi:dodecin